MTPTSGKSRVMMFSMLLGLGATLLVAAGHLAGLDRRLELLTLDWRFRTLGSAAPCDQIVNVNIDDPSLSVMGRWPWPRQQLAAMVDVLRQCGAQTVALDIILPHPQETRYVCETSDIYADDSGAALGAGRPVAVFDDLEMADTLQREANHVFLPMYVRPREHSTAMEEQFEGLVLSQGDVSLAAARETWARQYAVSEARQVDLSDDIRRAYVRARAMKALEALALPAGAAGDCPVVRGALVPPLVRFAQAVRRTGFVTMDPDEDGVVRRIPLLAGDGRAVFPQFALSLAAGELTGGAAAITADARNVTIAGPGGVVRRVPVDANGCMLINWMMPRPGRPWGTAQVSAAEVGMLYLYDQKIRRHADLRRQLCVKLWQLSGGSFRTPELAELFNRLGWDLLPKLDQVYLARVDAQAAYQRATLYDPLNCPPPPAELMADEKRLQDEIDRGFDQLLAELADPGHLRQYVTGAPATAPATAPTAEPAPGPTPQEKLAAAQETLALLARIPQADAVLVQERQKRLELLRPRIEGKTCLVGSTATGAADFVPTPADKRMPGVMVHANILNTILSGGFVHQASWLWDVLAVLAAGLLASHLAASQPGLRAAPATAVSAAVLVGANAVTVFHEWNIWLAMVAPLAAMALSFLLITIFRQLTEERAKRQIRGILTQTLSPALVDRVVEDPSLLKLGGEQRELSCFFSDLAGFTPLSKRLGEQETIKLLNRYFDRMAEVVQARHGGYLSKFMGDGIFVFFGAPVFQSDHPARVVRAAVECQQAVADFNRQLAAEAGDVQLVCRIGIATGPAMVGNCGSSDRIDYTAIGDTVNLASRLEGANKAFGTRILIEDETWFRAALTDVIARPMGKIFVVGRDEAVAVWNVLGYRDAIEPARQQAAAQFAQAIELFAARNFTAAAAAFEQLSLADPTDKAPAFYVSLCRQYLQSPPPEAWAGEVKLTEK